MRYITQSLVHFRNPIKRDIDGTSKHSRTSSFNVSISTQTNYNLHDNLELCLLNAVDLCLAGPLALVLGVGTLIAHRLSNDVWFGLLIDNEALSLLDRCESLLLDAMHQVVASGDVVDETDDLTGSPDL